jgi:ClpP class serine protease
MTGHLLISLDGARAYRAARQLGAAATSEQLERFEARSALGSNGSPSIMQVVAGVAEISIAGVLTEVADFYAAYFGGGNTAYRDIRAALHLAASDPAVHEVVLSVSSPGGTVAGLFETLAVLETFPKPIRAQASMACSAAFALVAQCDSVQAATGASFFGSVGVAVSMFVDDSVVDITNKESPDKRPDVSTEEGKAVVQKELDGIFELFASSIARGRGVTVERVTSAFGRGATVLSSAAIESGMIDGLVPSAPKVASVATAPVETLAELLVTRLPEEDAHAYVRRCTALLEHVRRPAEAPKKVPTETLAQAVQRVSAETPAPFPSGAPEGSQGMASALLALSTPVAEDTAEVTLEDISAAIVAHQQAMPKPQPTNRKALGEALTRAEQLDWSEE